MVGNSGRYSKFQQRLRNIYLIWLSKKRKVNGVSKEKTNDLPKKEINHKLDVFSKDETVKNENIEVVEKSNINSLEKKDKKLNSIAKGSSYVLAANVIKNNIGIRENNKEVNNLKNNTTKIRKKDGIDLIKIDIINKLKDKFIEKEALLEVIESELFFITEAIDNSFEYKEVNELRKKINEVIEQINDIISQYNLYNENYDMSNVIGIDDNLIVEDIINYRNLLSSYGDRKKFVKEYKLLDEFESLYCKLEVIRIKTEKINDYSEEVIERYGSRDKKYDQLKLKLIDIVGVNRDCMYEIKKQNEYLSELMKKISVIDKDEYVTKRLTGLNALISQGLKFIGLKLLSPFAGFVPSIIGETLVTRNMIKSIYRNLHYKEVKKVYYNAVDFERELNSKITDISYTENLVEETLGDLKDLKADFMLIYDSNIPEYEETLKNINQMEEIMQKNQYRVGFIKGKLKDSKRINKNKMIKVKKLNEGRN